MKVFFSILITILSFGYISAQKDTLTLKYASFEQSTMKGGQDGGGVRGWYDCGRINFPDETPPDIHPKDFWENRKQAKDGKTYLGMVVRDNNSWESVSQRLSEPLKANECYSFSVYLARSEKYLSGSQLKDDRRPIYNYTTPSVLRIWGGTGACGDKELLGESAAIDHSDWQRYDFKLQPSFDLRYITLEAFYKTPVFYLYNGHILVDGLSQIIQIDCDAPEEVAVVEPKIPAAPPHKRKKKKKEKQPTPEPEKAEVIAAAPPTKILKALDRDRIKEGQTIEIEKLFFKADTTSINQESYAVLDEVYTFMQEHRDVVIEIGGHTNGLPKHDFCDRLSTQRAKAVAEYLAKKGVQPSRLKYKGYGKRKPIASNLSKEGRKKNQRVEIKILSIG